MEGGTLFQLRNLINRRNVTKDPTSNMSACEDFFLHIVEAHILSAIMTAFGMSSLDDTPCDDIFTEADSLTRRQIVINAIQKVLENYLEFLIGGEENTDERSHNDHVLSYARDVLSLGLLYMEFQDGIREGDGERILRCWRYLLLVFKASRRTNYSVEAFTLLAQYHFTFRE